MRIKIIEFSKRNDNKTLKDHLFDKYCESIRYQILSKILEWLAEEAGVSREKGKLVTETDTVLAFIF